MMTGAHGDAHFVQQGAEVVVVETFDAKGEDAGAVGRAEEVDAIIAGAR